MQAAAFDYAPMTITVLPSAEPAVILVHGSGWTGATKRIWLMLVAEGGFWSAIEIRDKLRLPSGINNVLRDMVEYGCVVQKKRRSIDGENLTEYGVVRKCKVPRGVTWEEIAELRGVQ